MPESQDNFEGTFLVTRNSANLVSNNNNSGWDANL